MTRIECFESPTTHCNSNFGAGLLSNLYTPRRFLLGPLMNEYHWQVCFNEGAKLRCRGLTRLDPGLRINLDLNFVKH